MVKLLNAALDERTVNGKKEIFAHGWIGAESFGELKTDDYQREILAAKGRKNKIQQAVEEGTRLPDIMLGMRGQKVRFHGDDLFLENDVYIVDGLQRVAALRRVIEASPTQALRDEVRIGAEVRFGTTRETERDLFLVLNGGRTPVAPSVYLRNIREENRAVLTLYGLSNADREFVLYKRVQWTQRGHRGTVLTALVAARVANELHRHFPTNIRRDSTTGTPRMRRSASGVIAIADILDGRANTVGLRQFRDNVKTFFEVIDESYGIRNIEYTQLASHMKGNFLMAVAKTMSDHVNFWDGDELVVSPEMRKKLRTFAITDPEIRRLSGSGGGAIPLLEKLLRDHINKGMTKNKLRPRFLEREYARRSGNGVDYAEAHA